MTLARRSDSSVSPGCRNTWAGVAGGISSSMIAAPTTTVGGGAISARVPAGSRRRVPSGNRSRIDSVAMKLSWLLAESRCGFTAATRPISRPCRTTRVSCVRPSASAARMCST